MSIDFMGYKPLEQDHKFWMVVNPATWLMPILIAVAAVAITVHLYAFSLPGQGFSAAPEAAPAEEAAAAEEAAPAAEAAPAEEAAPAAEAAPAEEAAPAAEAAAAQ